MPGNSQGQRLLHGSQQFRKDRAWGIDLSIALLGVFLSASAQAAVFTVNSPSDVVDASPGNGVCETAPRNGVCTLRAAIQEANALAGADQIILPPNTYLLTIGIELTITDSLTITGGGASTTIIDGNKSVRPGGVLVNSSGSTVNLSGVTVRNGGRTDGGGIYNNLGTMTLTNSIVSGNIATDGGAIFNSGTLTLTNSTVSGNGAISIGGGIAKQGGTANLFNATITNNTIGFRSAFGGGVFNALSATFNFQNTILAGNFTSGLPSDWLRSLQNNGGWHVVHFAKL
jgi:CSLREA domain-containing protein